MHLDDTVVEPADSHEPTLEKHPRTAAIAGWVGSVLEYYDFFIYGTAAALVFGRIFFPNSDPTAGTLLALATFGIGYVARPLGAVFLGHWGDKFGRKKVLVFTLLLMGISTFLVGCLPTYDQVGLLAPLGLVVLRLCQGLSAAGEQSGAGSVALEHAPANRRAFYASFVLNGTQAGAVLAALVFLPVAALPEQQLLAWGWRVPFLASAVVIAVGLWIRRNLPETPAFQEEVQHGEVAKLPFVELLHDSWPDIVRLLLATLTSAVSTVFSVYALAYATGVVKLDRSTMLWVGIVTNIVAMGAIPLWALLADRIGRKPVFIFGAVGSGVLMFAYLAAIGTANYLLIFACGILMSGIVYSAYNGVAPAFFAELFSTRVRVSGTAFGTQIGIAIGGFVPAIAAAIAGPGPDGWYPVAALVVACCLLAAGAAATARDNFRVHMHDLGKKEAPVPAPAPVRA